MNNHEDVADVRDQTNESERRVSVRDFALIMRYM